MRKEYGHFPHDMMIKCSIARKYLNIQGQFVISLAQKRLLVKNASLGWMDKVMITITLLSDNLSGFVIQNKKKEIIFYTSAFYLRKNALKHFFVYIIQLFVE